MLWWLQRETKRRTEIIRNSFWGDSFRATIYLGVDSPFFSTIVLVKTQLFPWIFDGFLKRLGSLERMEMGQVPPECPVLFGGSPQQTGETKKAGGPPASPLAFLGSGRCGWSSGARRCRASRRRRGPRWTEGAARSK